MSKIMNRRMVRRQFLKRAGGSILTAGLLPAVSVADVPTDPKELQKLADRYVQLWLLINQYRESNKLPPIPLSPKLTKVADTHIADWVKHKNEIQALGCNLHGWSKPVAGEPWKTFGCFVAGNYQVMWGKPKEITGYPGNGYENSASGGGNLSPQDALNMWKSDAAHNDVMLNKDGWSTPWQALGTACGDGYAYAWFGNELDDPPVAAKNGIQGQWVSNLGQVNLFKAKDQIDCPFVFCPTGHFVQMRGYWKGAELQFAGVTVQYPPREVKVVGPALARLYLSDDGQTLMGWIWWAYAGQWAWYLRKYKNF